MVALLLLLIANCAIGEGVYILERLVKLHYEVVAEVVTNATTIAC